MDSNTFIGFEECISSMRTRVPKEGKLSKALEGVWRDGGDCWKGRRLWKAIVTDEEEVRWTDDLVNTSAGSNFLRISLPFLFYFPHYFLGLFD